MAKRQSALPAPAWTGDLPVFERRLANGLKALVLPRASSPIAVFDIYYPAGSVNDTPGKSGLAHFVEHMLFKGTARFPKGYIDRLAFLASGQSNAETGEDFTHYWFALPTERWELALAIEADRMLGARFEPAEVEAERQVIGEERARELGSPAGRLDQAHLAMSYLVHPYRNPILGWPEDLANTSAEDLAKFHRRHYLPDGAVVVVVGHLDPERALDRIEAHFGSLAGAAVGSSAQTPAEPVQTGRREFQLLESEAIARGLLGWHTVPRGHKDAAALDVLADMLCCGRQSRLWHQLVEEQNVATWIDAQHDSGQLAGQFLVHVDAAPGAIPASVEAEIFGEIDRLAHEGPTPAELKRSRHRLEAAWRFEQEEPSGLAGGLGQVALWGDWRNWQAEYRATLAVSASDIRRVAVRYFSRYALTVGWSLPRPARTNVWSPTSKASQAISRKLPQTLPRGQPSWPDDIVLPAVTASLPELAPDRFVLSNGLRVLTERRAGTGTLAIDLHVDSGMIHEQKPGLAYFTARLREEGTASRSPEEFSAAIEDVGGTLELSATGASARVRSDDLDLTLDLLADVMIRPAFPADAVEWTKAKIGAEIKADRDDAAFRAELLFRSLIYGSHPYSRSTRGTARSVGTFERADAIEHQSRWVAPARAFLVVVGDFEAGELRSAIRRHFGSWIAPDLRTGGPARGRLPRFEIPQPKARTRRVRNDGEQVHLMMGHVGVTRRHRDFDALCVLDHILGTGPGFTDRLSRVIRDELGLAYSVGGGFTDSADVYPGLFRLYAGTGPREARRALEALRAQVAAIHAGEFSDDEVERAKTYLQSAWIFDYQTVGQRAERLLELEYFGLPLSEPADWPRRISRLSTNRIRRVAARHLKPDAMVVVEYGPILRRRGR
jgi:zinc protease